MTQSLNTKEHQKQRCAIYRLSYLSKWHDVMFDVRPGDGFGIFTVISDYYGDSRIVFSHAVNQILKLIITQESLCSYGNEGADIVLCRERRSNKQLLANHVSHYR